MGLNPRSKHIELKFLWLQDHHKNGVIKVKGFLLKKILPTSSPKMCQHRLWLNIFFSVVFKNFVSEKGYNYHRYNSYIFFADAKFRKGFHQALPLLQEQQEEEIDQHLYDIDICMTDSTTEDSIYQHNIYREDGYTDSSRSPTEKATAAAKEEQAAAAAAAAAAADTTAAGRAAGFSRTSSSHSISTTHDHDIDIPNDNKGRTTERVSILERVVFVIFVTFVILPEKDEKNIISRKGQGRGRRKERRKEKRRSEEHHHRSASTAIVAIRKHQERTIIMATSSLILFTSSLSSALASSLPFAIKTFGYINHLHSKVLTISGHIKHLEGHLLSISSWSIGNISCSSYWNISSNIKSIFSKMAAAPSSQPSQQMDITENEEQQIIEEASATSSIRG